MAAALQATARDHIALARTLPDRLLRFFAYNPPRVVAAHRSSAASSDTLESPPSSSSSPSNQPSEQDSLFSRWKNPFIPHRNPSTGRWHPPIYSLRRQAELVKLAASHGVEELLPYTPKSTIERRRRREEQGLRVRGTGVGQRIKGHRWERMLEGKLDQRRKAMLDMPRLVQEWKLRGHGRGIRKWPK